MAGRQALERHGADGRDEVNLNLGSMLGPRARADLRPQARKPVVAQERTRQALGGLGVAALVELGEQRPLGSLGIPLGLEPTVPVTDALAARAATTIDDDADAVAALDDGHRN